MTMTTKRGGTTTREGHDDKREGGQRGKMMTPTPGPGDTYLLDCFFFSFFFGPTPTNRVVL